MTYIWNIDGVIIVNATNIESARVIAEDYLRNEAKKRVDSYTEASKTFTHQSNEEKEAGIKKVADANASCLKRDIEGLALEPSVLQNGELYQIHSEDFE